jgi:hypothetical protein
VAVVLVADDQLERPEPEFGQCLFEFELGDLHAYLRVVDEHPGHGGQPHLLPR